MKRAAIILLAFMIFSCESSDVEVIPDYTLKYHSLESEKRDKAKEIFKQIDFEKILEYKNLSQNEQVTIYLTHLKLFVNEDGKIEKVQLRTAVPRKNFAKYARKIEHEISSGIYQPIINKLSEFEYPFSKIEGQKVKTRINLALNKYLSKTDLIKKMKGQKDKTYFVAVEEMPSPIGGLKAIQEKIVYPEKAKQNGVEGRVYVKAFVNKKGVVEKVIIIKGIGYGCDSVAIEAVKTTKFKPGTQRGKKLPVQVSIPIKFQLD